VIPTREVLSDGLLATFVNMSKEPLSLYRAESDGTIGPYRGSVDPFESGSPRQCASFGNVYHFVVPNTREIVCTFKIEPKVSMYYFDPFVANNPSDPSAGVHSQPIQSPKELQSDSLKLYSAAARKRIFAAALAGKHH